MIARTLAAAALVLAAACSGDAARDADVPPSFSLRGRQRDPMHLTYRVEPAAGPIANEVFAAAIARAAASWNATGVVHFAPATGDARADVEIGWRRGHHGACEPFGSGHAFAHSGPMTTPTFVHFDAARAWSDGSGDGANVEAIALHELGHVLGLGHSSDPDAVMSSEPRDERHLRPGAADLCGLHTLYGGGADEAGDLLVRAADGRTLAVLRAVAPPASTTAFAMDLDGDGRTEVCVHRTDAKGHGAMVGYAFDAEGRIERTLGPYAGLATPGARLAPALASNGARLLVVDLGNGRRIAHRFDEHGLAWPWTGPVPECAAPSDDSRLEADVTGDGTRESVERRVRRTDAR